MTPRARHLQEFLYAQEHNILLPEARKRLAAERRRLAEAAVRNLLDQPISTRRLPTQESQDEGQTPPRWMMAD